MIFSRPIKDCPLFIEVTEHNPPLISFGARGTKEKGFMQPCNVTVDRRNNVFVVDTVWEGFKLHAHSYVSRGKKSLTAIAY